MLPDSDPALSAPTRHDEPLPPPAPATSAPADPDPSEPTRPGRGRAARPGRLTAAAARVASSCWSWCRPSGRPAAAAAAPPPAADGAPSASRTARTAAPRRNRWRDHPAGTGQSQRTGGAQRSESGYAPLSVMLQRVVSSQLSQSVKVGSRAGEEATILNIN